MNSLIKPFTILNIFVLIFILSCFSFFIDKSWAEIKPASTQSYKISYVLNGGKNNTNNPVNYNGSKTIALKNPTKKGYTFQGWYLDSNFTKKITTIAKGSKGNKKLYAKWIINPPLTGLSGRANLNNHIKTFKNRYKNSLKNGIALVGSSSFARWNVANEFEAVGWNLQKVYNCSVSGARISDFSSNNEYIKLIASFQPSIVIIYGSNDLGVSSNDATKNKALTDKLIKDIDSLISKISAKCSKKPTFIVIGSTKTPKDYINAYKNKTNSSNSCIAWDRIDIYNNKLKQYANKKSNIIYYNIAKDFEYKDAKNRMIFYIDQNKKQIANIKEIMAGTKTLKLFEKDNAHPSTLAYKTIWKKLVQFAVLKTKNN